MKNPVVVLEKEALRTSFGGRLYPWDTTYIPEEFIASTFAVK